MTLQLPIVISLVSVAWSIGLCVGMFTARFMSKKECKDNREELWNQVDAMRNCMTGGKMVFELNQVKTS